MSSVFEQSAASSPSFGTPSFAVRWHRSIRRPVGAVAGPIVRPMSLEGKRCFALGQDTAGRHGGSLNTGGGLRRLREVLNRP